MGPAADAARPGGWLLACYRQFGRLAATEDEVLADPLLLPDALPEAPLPVVLPLALGLGLALPVEDEPLPVVSLAWPVTLSLQCVAAEIVLDGLVALGEELGDVGDELD